MDRRTAEKIQKLNALAQSDDIFSAYARTVRDLEPVLEGTLEHLPEEQRRQAAACCEYLKLMNRRLAAIACEHMEFQN